MYHDTDILLSITAPALTRNKTKAKKERDYIFILF